MLWVHIRRASESPRRFLLVPITYVFLRKKIDEIYLNFLKISCSPQHCEFIYISLTFSYLATPRLAQVCSLIFCIIIKNDNKKKSSPTSLM